MTVDTCIQKMTLEEKAMLLQGKTSWRTHNLPRLGIPSMFMADGPHGLRKQAGNEDHLGINESLPATCFPTAATMANSWNPELGQELGRALGQEASANDVHVVLGPGLNIKRSPLCGRNFEYFSEDPYLAGKMAAAYIQGIQWGGVGACPKHFAVNSQELRRMSTDSVLDERTLREIYLTGFEIAVKEGNPKSIMSSYNLVNGVYANENAHLLTDILRKQWGFKGYVVTDWGASNDHVEGVRAGSALEMPNPGADSALALVQAVRAGVLSEKFLDERLRELLPVIFETCGAVARSAKIYDHQAHHNLAAKCAAESIVLLENDGILPLQPGVKVALIGAFAEKPRYQGAGSSMVNPTAMVCLKDCLAEEALEDFRYAPGYIRGEDRIDEELLRQAVETAKLADVVLLCIGLDETTESEGMDRENMCLPQSHLKLLEAVSAENPNIVLVLSGGAPFEMPKDGFRAAIHGYLSGQAGAIAMAGALVGRVNPSGKRAETWPLKLEDTPCYRYYPGTGKTAQYREGLYVGYRYYDTAGVPVRYPFGYGKSYTTFAYSNLTADSRSVTFTLTNTGDYDGAEVAQVYITCRNGQVFRPKKELKAFRKVFLKAGESCKVVIPLDDKAFRYFNTETGKFEVETANYDVMVAASVADIKLMATIRVFGTDAPVPELVLPAYRSGKVTNVSDEEFAALLGRPLPADAAEGKLTVLDTVSQFYRAKGMVARWLGKCVERSIQRSRAKGDPAPNALFAYNLPIRGFCQMTQGKITRKMTQDIVHMVNGHFLTGLCRFVVHFVTGRIQAAKFWKSIREPLK